MFDVNYFNSLNCLNENFFLNYNNILGKMVGPYTLEFNFFLKRILCVEF